MLLESHERLVSLNEKIKQENEVLMDQFHEMVMNKPHKKVPWYRIPGKILYFSLLPITNPFRYKLIMKTLERIETTNLGTRKDDRRQN
jgi:hypothetical protein